MFSGYQGNNSPICRCLLVFHYSVYITSLNILSVLCLIPKVQLITLEQEERYFHLLIVQF